MPNRRIDVDAIIDKIRTKEQASDPATPSFGFGWLYCKSDGVYFRQDDGTVVGPFGAGGGGDHAYYTNLAALLEPDAIEPVEVGPFSYNISSSETKYLLLGWQIRIGSAGRIIVRNPRNPLPLRNVTLTSIFDGAGAKSSAVILDPTLPTYVNARETYFDRLNAIAGYDTKYIGFDSGNQVEPLLTGAYGAILTHVTCNDFAWIAMFGFRGASNIGYPIDYEIGDDATERMRFAHNLTVPINKKIVGTIASTVGEVTGQLGGAITYVLLPSTWSAITDPLLPYDFQDDFMGSSLDTASTWTRVQSTVGNVEIDTQYHWCKMVGNNTWGDNGMYSQSSIPRADGTVFLTDVYTTEGVAPHLDISLMVGFSDGAGQHFTNMAHAVYFTDNLYVFENGVSRGIVGSSYSGGNIYRVRITLGVGGAATYEIQGGPQYPVIGGASWTDITPGTTDSSTDPLYPAATKERGSVCYWSDPRVYS